MKHAKSGKISAHPVLGTSAWWGDDTSLYKLSGMGGKQKKATGRPCRFFSSSLLFFFHRCAMFCTNCANQHLQNLCRFAEFVKNSTLDFKGFFQLRANFRAPKFAEILKKSYKICALRENFVANHYKSKTYDRRIDGLLVEILPEVLAGPRACLA